MMMMMRDVQQLGAEDTYRRRIRNRSRYLLRPTLQINFKKKNIIRESNAQGVASGDPIKAIWFQSKDSSENPRPLRYPKIWLTFCMTNVWILYRDSQKEGRHTLLFGANQQTWWGSSGYTSLTSLSETYPAKEATKSEKVRNSNAGSRIETYLKAWKRYPGIISTWQLIRRQSPGDQLSTYTTQQLRRTHRERIALCSYLRDFQRRHSFGSAECWKARIVRGYWAILMKTGYDRLSHRKILCLLMEGGATRKRRAMPPIENPISCVDMTNIHPS